MMTGLIRRILEMKEEEGLKRGRPALVSARLPDSVEYCMDMGLDIERWAQEDLVVIFVMGGGFRLNEREYSVEFGRRHDVPVYGDFSNPRVTGETRFARRSSESYRAGAMNAWAAGVDGIHVFNEYNPSAPCLGETGDPHILPDLDKLYYTNIRGCASERPAGPEYYAIAPVFSGPVSQTIALYESGSTRRPSALCI